MRQRSTGGQKKTSTPCKMAANGKVTMPSQACRLAKDLSQLPVSRPDATSVQRNAPLGSEHTQNEPRDALIKRALKSPFSTRTTRSLDRSLGTGSSFGLPTGLRLRLEQLSGIDLSDVRVHYNSSKAMQVNALAYTKGSEIHVGPGQEQHLAHEGWHVVQQKQGRVKPTTLQANGLSINADVNLEREADVMGCKALSLTNAHEHFSGIRSVRSAPTSGSIQRKRRKQRAASSQRGQTGSRQLLLQRNPWLTRIENYEEILSRYVKILNLRMKRKRLEEQYERLPKTILSEHQAALRKQRLKILRVSEQTAKVQNLTEVDLIPLLHPDAIPDPQQPADIGKAALMKEMKTRGGTIELLDGTTGRIGVFLKPHAWRIPIQQDGIHLANLLTLQKLRVFVYKKAIIKAQLDLYERFFQENPWAMQIFAKQFAEREKAKALTEPERPEEERLVGEYLQDRRLYAARVREEYARAAAVPAFFLGLFAIHGPVDLLLTVAPVGKLGKGVWNAGKKLVKLAGKRKNKKALEEFARLAPKFFDGLGKEGAQFIRLAEKLPKAQIRAAKTIHAHGGSMVVIQRLMTKYANGHADLRWIAKLLENKKLDIAFVERFTTYEANVSWNTLRKVVAGGKLGRSVPRGLRDDLAVKLKGLLGEEAAERIVKGRRLLGQKPEILARGFFYGGKKSIDIVAQVVVGKKTKYYFVEVKNWSVGTWMKGHQQVVDQLKRHNDGIGVFFKNIVGNSKDNLAGKVLMVEREGFKLLSRMQKAEIKKKITALGWRIEFIPPDKIQRFGDLIDRLR